MIMMMARDTFRQSMTFLDQSNHGSISPSSLNTTTTVVATTTTTTTTTSATTLLLRKHSKKWVISYNYRFFPDLIRKKSTSINKVAIVFVLPKVSSTQNCYSILSGVTFCESKASQLAWSIFHIAYKQKAFIQCVCKYVIWDTSEEQILCRNNGIWMDVQIDASSSGVVERI